MGALIDGEIENGDAVAAFGIGDNGLGIATRLFQNTAIPCHAVAKGGKGIARGTNIND